MTKDKDIIEEDEVFSIAPAGNKSEVKESKSKSESEKQSRKRLLTRFSDAENSYYFQMHSFFSIPEIQELLAENGISPSKYKFDYSRAKESENYVIIERNGNELSLNQVFADNFEAFTKICTEKHFAIYSDAVSDKFSFNFTAEEMTAWLKRYPQTIFRNFEYNRAAHAIEPKADNAEHFDIDRTINSKIENLYNSSLNVQDKKIKDFKTKLASAIETFNECFEMQKDGICIKQNNGWIDEVLETGTKYLATHQGSNSTDYWFESLTSIFSINDRDFLSLVSFVSNSILVRLKGDEQAYRVIVITGDSGIGKDSFIQGLLTGLNYRKANTYILRGSLKGATGFSVATEKKMKGVMYNYIGDDLSAANNSTDLDTITNSQFAIEVKGKTQKLIPKRFNSVITNNKPGVIFSKEKDHNAIARRYDFFEIKYAKGCTSPDYAEFYSTYDEMFDAYWAGFFTFCYELSKLDDKVKLLSNKARDYTLDNLHRLFYQGNDDNRILDFLTTIYDREFDKAEDSSLIEKNEFVKVIKEQNWLIIKSVSNYFKLDNKLSGEAIKKVVASHIKGAKFNSTYRDGHKVKSAAIMIPCQYFLGDVVLEIDSEAPAKEEKINLIENFKKYL